MTNRMFVEFHIIQTLPPSNINRDDTGSPKTAVFGGVRRARVSSQAWKKATRDAFRDSAEDLFMSGVVTGMRTKYAVSLVKSAIVSRRPDLADDAEQMATKAVQHALVGKKAIAAQKGAEEKITEVVDGKPRTKYLIGLTTIQADKLAELCIDALTSDKGFDKAKAKTILQQDNAIDVALFGRMVADDPTLNVDAACQVAHSIGIHRSETEFDYFTAVDDLSRAEREEQAAGAGMIGTVEFTSATLYRYATVDVPHLQENLGGSVEATARVVRAFAEAFITSMPTGKQNTFANRTLPAAVVVQLRATQPVSLVNAFERPIEPVREKGRTELACEELVRQNGMLDAAFGVASSQAFVLLAAPGTESLLALGQQVTLTELGDALEAVVRTRCEEEME